MCRILEDLNYGNITPGEQQMASGSVLKQAVDLLILEHEKHPDNPYMFPSPKTGTMYDPDSFRHIRAPRKVCGAVELLAVHVCF